MRGVHRHAKAQNVEFTAVCDPWRIARERAAAKATEWFGRKPLQFASYRDVVARDDVDAVIVATQTAINHIQTVIATSMAKERTERYPTAGHLAEALAYVRRGLTPPPGFSPSEIVRWLTSENGEYRSLLTP